MIELFCVYYQLVVAPAFLPNVGCPFGWCSMERPLDGHTSKEWQIMLCGEAPEEGKVGP